MNVRISVLPSQRLVGVIEWRMPMLEPKIYMIGVGDVLTLNMQLKESLGDVLNGLIASQTSQRGYRVQEDGTISIPDIGRVVIGGLTLQEAESVVYQRLLARVCLHRSALKLLNLTLKKFLSVVT